MRALLLIPGMLGSMAWLHAQPAPLAPPAVPSVSFAPAVNYSIGGTPMALGAGDFNGDGHIDLAVLRDQPGGVDILLGGTNGGFRLAQTLPMPYYWMGCYQLVVGDLNSDGNLDLAITQTIPGAVRVFLGDGTGCFEAAETFAFANAPIALAVADFNDDGKPDLAFANADAGTQLGILIGTGDGTFRPLPPQPVGAGPGTLVVGDFDGDGNPDLVLRYPGQDRLSLLRGQGDGTFLPEERVEAKDSPVGVACGDFNGDGKLDLVTANWDGDSVSVFLGRGDGTFQTPTDYEAGNLPVVVAAADLNGDGHVDLVVGHHQGTELDVLLGTGAGTFLGPLTFRIGAGVRSLIIADLDGDGRPDIATVNLYDKTVSVLLNRTERGSAGPGTYQHLPSVVRQVQDQAGPTESGLRAIEKSLSDYRIDQWTTDKGLPQNTVQCLLQTQDGYLWVGIQSGLARSDGLGYTVFDRNTTPAFKSDNILCLAEGPDHTLWIGTSDGLVRFRNRTFSYFRTRLTPGDKHVWGLNASRSGSVWLVADAGLARFDGDHPTLLLGGAIATSVVEDDSGRLWLGGKSGLLQRPSGSTNYEAVFQTESPASLNAPNSLCRDSEGNLWFGNESGLWRWKDGRLKLYGAKQGLSPGIVSCIAPDNESGLWLAVGGHVNHFQKERIVRFESASVLPDTFVACVYPDREGNIWLGTAQSGLVRLAPRRLVTYTTRDGLVNDQVWVNLRRARE
jgi:FG-GAP-like repeat/Two component regulator propeller